MADVLSHTGKPLKVSVDPARYFLARFACPRCKYTAVRRRELRLAGKKVQTWCPGCNSNVTVSVPMESDIGESGTEAEANRVQ